MKQRNAYLVRFNDPTTNNECQFENHTYAKCEWACGILWDNGEWQVLWGASLPAVIGDLTDLYAKVTGSPSISHLAIGKVETLPSLPNE
jgi:hypothetical protein